MTKILVQNTTNIAYDSGDDALNDNAFIASIYEWTELCNNDTTYNEHNNDARDHRSCQWDE